MLRTSTLFLICFALCFLAHAETFTLRFNDGTANTVELTGSQTASGTYSITAASGSIDGYAATLAYPGAYGSNDNVLLFPGADGVYLDFFGLAFSLGRGLLYNLYYDPYPLARGYRASLSDGTLDVVNSVSVIANGTNLAATPEPESLVLLGTGLFGIFILVRQRRWQRALL